MGALTTKLGLYKPALDEVGWHALVNANWDLLDDVLLQANQYVDGVKIFTSIPQLPADTPTLPTHAVTKAYVDSLGGGGGGGGTVLSAISIDTSQSPYAVAVNIILLVSAASGNVIVNLPAVAGNTSKQIWIKKKNAANEIHVTPAGSSKIDTDFTNAAPLKLYSQNEKVGLVCDGTDWWVIS